MGGQARGDARGVDGFCSHLPAPCHAFFCRQAWFAPSPLATGGCPPEATLQYSAEDAGSSGACRPYLACQVSRWAAMSGSRIGRISNVACHRAFVLQEQATSCSTWLTAKRCAGKHGAEEDNADYEGLRLIAREGTPAVLM